MPDIPQVELDEKDFFNEAVVAPLTSYRAGGLEKIYEVYANRRMRPPSEYFGYTPLEGFPTGKWGAYTDLFNIPVRERLFTDKAFLLLIVLGYLMSGRNIPSDVEKLLKRVNSYG